MRASDHLPRNRLDRAADWLNARTVILEIRAGQLQMLPKNGNGCCLYRIKYNSMYNNILAYSIPRIIIRSNYHVGTLMLR